MWRYVYVYLKAITEFGELVTTQLYSLVLDTWNIP